jgi:hypothetical protein
MNGMLDKEEDVAEKQIYERLRHKMSSRQEQTQLVKLFQTIAKNDFQSRSRVSPERLRAIYGADSTIVKVAMGDRSTRTAGDDQSESASRFARSAGGTRAGQSLEKMQEYYWQCAQKVLVDTRVCGELESSMAKYYGIDALRKQTAAIKIQRFVRRHLDTLLLYERSMRTLDAAANARIANKARAKSEILEGLEKERSAREQERERGPRRNSFNRAPALSAHLSSSSLEKDRTDISGSSRRKSKWMVRSMSKRASTGASSQPSRPDSALPFLTKNESIGATSSEHARSSIDAASFGDEQPTDRGAFSGHMQPASWARQSSSMRAETTEKKTAEYLQDSGFRGYNPPLKFVSPSTGDVRMPTPDYMQPFQVVRSPKSRERSSRERASQTRLSSPTPPQHRGATPLISARTVPSTAPTTPQGTVSPPLFERVPSDRESKRGVLVGEATGHLEDTHRSRTEQHISTEHANEPPTEISNIVPSFCSNVNDSNNSWLGPDSQYDPNHAAMISGQSSSAVDDRRMSAPSLHHHGASIVAEGDRPRTGLPLQEHRSERMQEYRAARRHDGHGKEARRVKAMERLGKSDQNPHGLPADVFEDMQKHVSLTTGMQFLRAMATDPKMFAPVSRADKKAWKERRRNQIAMRPMTFTLSTTK